MSGSFEANFIPETIEQTPFADTPAQIFFAKWCRFNDSIFPQFISREKWQQRGTQGLLEKMAQGKQKLFLPKDLHLWEMMDIINSVDHDTFARKPEKSGERAEQIKELGEIFEKAGIYLTEYIPELQEDDITAKEIAQVIAEEFYHYGLSLQHKEIEKDGLTRAVQLSKEDKAKLDEWFLGRDAYQKRLSRLTEDPTNEEIEDTRKKILRVYFKALAREGYKADGEKPWETRVGPMQHIQDRATRQIIKAIETPKTEMKTTIFARGTEKLVTEMKEVTTETRELGWRKSINTLLQAIGFDPLLEQRSLYHALHIDDLKQDLEAVRKSGDIEKISAKELEIARIIQNGVCGYTYKNGVGTYYPATMVRTQFINCVGSSILGGGLLDEVGIKYLLADLPEHSLTFLVTSDNKLYWQDFTPPNGSIFNSEITSDKLEGNIDLAELINIPDSGFTIEFRKWTLKNIKIRLYLSRPEIGLQCQILNNAGSVLLDLGRNEEALEAFKQAVAANPNMASSYNGLGIALNDLGRNEEAMAAFKRSIALDPKDSDPFNGIGRALMALGRFEEATEAFMQGLALNPNDYKTYYPLGFLYRMMGNNQQAIQMLKKHNEIKRNPNNKWVKKAEQAIKEMEKDVGNRRRWPF